MTINEFESLKVGDIVMQVKGKYKGEPAKVDYIWDVIDSNGYREILIFANYINPNIHKPGQTDFNCNYRFLKLIKKES